LKDCEVLGAQASDSNSLVFLKVSIVQEGSAEVEIATIGGAEEVYKLVLIKLYEMYLGLDFSIDGEMLLSLKVQGVEGFDLVGADPEPFLFQPPVRKRETWLDMHYRLLVPAIGSARDGAPPYAFKTQGKLCETRIVYKCDLCETLFTVATSERLKGIARLCAEDSESAGAVTAAMIDLQLAETTIVLPLADDKSRAFILRCGRVAYRTGIGVGSPCALQVPVVRHEFMVGPVQLVLDRIMAGAASADRVEIIHNFDIRVGAYRMLYPIHEYEARFPSAARQCAHSQLDASVSTLNGVFLHSQFRQVLGLVAQFQQAEDRRLSRMAASEARSSSDSVFSVEDALDRRMRRRSSFPLSPLSPTSLVSQTSVEAATLHRSGSRSRSVTPVRESSHGTGARGLALGLEVLGRLANIRIEVMTDVGSGVMAAPESLMVLQVGECALRAAKWVRSEWLVRLLLASIELNDTRPSHPVAPLDQVVRLLSDDDAEERGQTKDLLCASLGVWQFAQGIRTASQEDFQLAQQLEQWHVKVQFSSDDEPASDEKQQQPRAGEPCCAIMITSLRFQLVPEFVRVAAEFGLSFQDVGGQSSADSAGAQPARAGVLLRDSLLPSSPRGSQSPSISRAAAEPGHFLPSWMLPNDLIVNGNARLTEDMVLNPTCRLHILPVWRID
jgi:hypothetical protein